MKGSQLNKRHLQLTCCKTHLHHQPLPLLRREEAAPTLRVLNLGETVTLTGGELLQGTPQIRPQPLRQSCLFGRLEQPAQGVE